MIQKPHRKRKHVVLYITQVNINPSQRDDPRFESPLREIFTFNIYLFDRVSSSTKNKMKKTRQVSTTKRKDEKRKDPRSWNHEKKCVEEVGDVKRKVRVVRIESETVAVFFSAWWDVEKGGMMRKAWW